MPVDPLEAFLESARSVAAAVRQQGLGTQWLVHCDTDADGLASAAVAATTLRRLGHRFRVRASRDKTEDAYTELFQEDADAYLVLDKGTSHVDVLADGAARTGRPVVIIDHHNLRSDTVPDEVHLLNPRRHGLDGSRDACSSTSAVAFAVAALGDADGYRLAPTGLVGAIGDWQHMDGWHGWNARLVEEAVDAGHLERRREATYIGLDLTDAIAHRPRPELPGLSRDPDAVRAFLADLDLPADQDVGSMDRDGRTRLTTGLVLHGLAHGVAPDDLATLAMENLHHAALGMELRQAFRTVDACAREGRYATGVAFLMGDAMAREEAEGLYRRYRETLERNLARLRDEGAEARDATQHLRIEEPAYTGMVGGLGMTLVAKDRTRPMVVTAPRPDGDVQVSTRGTDEQVAAGMDLGRACQKAGETVGREGGGHPVAAGIVVAPGELDAFLDALDEALLAQGFLDGAD